MRHRKTQRRLFVLQLHDRIDPHHHTCELCSHQWTCRDTECYDTMDTCDDCLHRLDCPGCELDLRGSLEWDCDTEQSDGTRITQLSAVCPTCKTVIRYQDNDDGRGALMVQWLVRDPFSAIPYASFKGVPFPTRAIGKTKGTVKATVTIQSGGKTHVYKAEDVEFSIGGRKVDLTGIGVQGIEDDDP